MANDFEQPQSLGNEVTRTGETSRLDHLQHSGDTISSLGDQETGSDTRSSLSDLADFGDDGDEPQEIVDLESRYDILDVLGRGGMGEVVRAVDKRLKRKVALKRMRAELGASRQAMRRFLTEAVSVAALNHFNVVQIHDYGHTADGPFLVMELVEGPTLAERLQNGPLPLEEAIELAYQLCDGLQAAHDRGIIHRDIKPANILMTAAGTPKLTDFGLAKDVADTGHTQAGAVLGTLDYMAPEQKADSSRADARSDQWSLAATFYQMMTGETPRIIETDSIPEPVRDVVRRALKTNPVERFESVREFGEALQDAINPSGEPELDRSKLQEGQCAACGTVNDVSRKFCRDCGEGLQESCPECGGGTTVWERFCGECGIDISTAVESRLQSARDLVRAVQSLRTEYRHAKALEQITPLLSYGHSALQEHRQWAEKTHNRLTAELTELQSQRNQLLQAAREQVEIGSFSAAGKYLARIPEPLQTDMSRELAEQVTAAATEAKQLAAEIGTAVRARNYGGLDVKLERYLELKPQDERARTLLEKVRQRTEHNPPILSAAVRIPSRKPQWPLPPRKPVLIATAALVFAVGFAAFMIYGVRAPDGSTQDGTAAESGESEPHGILSAAGTAGNDGRVGPPTTVAPLNTRAIPRIDLPSQDESEPHSISSAGETVSTADRIGPTTPVDPSKDEEGVVTLFDGQTLDGWNGDSRYWSVENGTIIGTQPSQVKGGTFLATDKEYGDFILKAKFRLIEGNSGIQFRSRVLPDNLMSGYQADLAYHDNFNFMGWLYGERMGGKLATPSDSQKQALIKALDRSGWNECVITARGNQIAVDINGVQAIDTTHYGPERGAIGLQLHGGMKTKVAFKDIEIKELSQKSAENDRPTEVEKE